MELKLRYSDTIRNWMPRILACACILSMFITMGLPIFLGIIVSASQNALDANQKLQVGTEFNYEALFIFWGIVCCLFLLLATVGQDVARNISEGKDLFHKRNDIDW